MKIKFMRVIGTKMRPTRTTKNFEKIVIRGKMKLNLKMTFVVKNEGRKTIY